MMIYGVESRDALMRFFDSDAPKQYAGEREPFARIICAPSAGGAMSTSGLGER